MIVLPEFLSSVHVGVGPVPVALDDATARGVLWQANNRRFLLEVPNVARYLVESGSTITIDHASGAAVQKVGHFLGMLPLAALAFQRGLLAFHAAAVTNGEGALLLSGDSGSGKSTLMAGLLQRGWRMLADDLAIVGLDEQGVPTVYSIQTDVALWPVALDKLGIADDSLPLCDANRRAYSPLGQAKCLPQRLVGLYHLKVHNKPEVVIEEITAFARFQTTGTMLYNSHVADVLCDRAVFLHCASAIAGSATFLELRRPRGEWSLEKMLDVITNR